MFAIEHLEPETLVKPAIQVENQQGQDITMELDSVPISRTHSDTPPMPIVAPSPIRSADRATMQQSGLLNDKLDHEAVKTKAARRKKKKRGMKPAAPATTTVRGFHTPVTSGGEESDFSTRTPTPKGRITRDFPSVTSSPAFRPASGAGGLSALKLQLDTLNITSNPGSPTRPLLQKMTTASSNVSVISGAGTDDSDRTENESYEINIEQDFVSPDVPSKPLPGLIADNSRQPSLVRKMTANDFVPLTCLGKGAYGTVLLVKQRETGRLYAQKQFKKASLKVHKKLIEQTKTERSILESVNRHPFIVNLYYAFQDHEKLYLILEYAEGGELFHHLAMERMFSEETAAFYMAELVLALEHLHNDVGVVYRDLKPENCLLDSEGHLLLTDFGLSKVSVNEDDRCNSVLGTIEYMAPEVVQGLKYGPAVDWWSLGALGFDLLTGAPPFQGNSHAKTQEKILRQKLTMPYFLSPDAKDLLTRLLRKEPNKRLGSHMPRDLQTIKSIASSARSTGGSSQRELDPPIQPLVTDPELAENFSTDFTDLALSPVIGKGGAFDSFGDSEPMSAFPGENDPFGGFSFVASSSLLEREGEFLMA